LTFILSILCYRCLHPKLKSVFKILGTIGGSEKDGLKQGSVICEKEPLNVCYKVDSKGVMHPLKDRRPVRLLRVYKKK